MLLHDSLRWAVTAEVVDLPLLRHLVSVEFPGTTPDQASTHKRPRDSMLFLNIVHFMMRRFMRA